MGAGQAGVFLPAPGLHPAPMLPCLDVTLLLPPVPQLCHCQVAATTSWGRGISKGALSPVLLSPHATSILLSRGSVPK